MSQNQQDKDKTSEAKTTTSVEAKTSTATKARTTTATKAKTSTATKAKTTTATKAKTTAVAKAKTSASSDQLNVVDTKKSTVKKANFYYGTGRRKSSTAKVFLYKGTGKIEINKSSLVDYFGRKTAHMVIKQPLLLTGTLDSFDVKVQVSGGGNSGQAGAIRHGITRALLDFDIELKQQLRKAGYVTRDSRVVERKKLGLRKARKKEQYSKR